MRDNFKKGVVRFGFLTEFDEIIRSPARGYETDQNRLFPLHLDPIDVGLSKNRNDWTVLSGDFQQARWHVPNSKTEKKKKYKHGYHW